MFKKKIMRILKKNYKKIGDLHKAYLFEVNSLNIRKSVLKTSHHKRQQYFIVNFFNELIYKVFSCGLLLNKATRKIKFFKKAKQNIGFIVVSLKQRVCVHFLKLLFCKNFNQKQQFWLKKFYKVVKPKIDNFIATKTWPYCPKKFRRLKKHVFRKIIIQD